MSKTLDLVRGIIRPESTPAKKPLIVVGVPSMDMLNANFAMALAQFHYRMGALHQPIALINSKGSIVAINRNNIVRRAQQLGAAKVFFIDSDMSFPMDGLERLLSSGKSIVGASYPQRTGLHKNLVKPKGNLRQDVPTDALVEVDGLPTGFLLIDMAIFADLKRPYFRFTVNEEKEEVGGEDYDFCDRARAAGHSVWLDPALSYELIHWGECGWRLDQELCGVDANQPDAALVQLENS